MVCFEDVKLITFLNDVNSYSYQIYLATVEIMEFLKTNI